VSSVLSILAAVLAVSALIIVHECGHYFAARAVGMRVERFSFGFGKPLLSFRRNGTDFTVSPFLIGGFVMVAGAGPSAEVSPDDTGAYANKSAWRRFAFILAGPVMNWVTAVGVAWVLLASVGLPVADPSSRVGQPLPGMPAEAAGLKAGDRIEAVAGTRVSTWEELVAQIQRHPGDQVAVEVVRGEGAGAQRLVLQVTPKDSGGVGKVGLEPATRPYRTGSLAAIPAAVSLTNENLVRQLQGFASIFARKQRTELTGPIGIAQDLVRGAKVGAGRFLGLVWMVSVGLAVLNLLPFPSLDGSRLLFLGWELVTRRRVNERVEGIIHTGGFIVLVLLILAVSLGDVARLLR
jgi:regulator of sigma E protease